MATNFFGENIYCNQQIIIMFMYLLVLGIRDRKRIRFRNISAIIVLKKFVFQ